MNKKTLLAIFRDKAADYFEEVEATSMGYKDKAALLNRMIVRFRESYIEEVDNTIKNIDEKLHAILLVTYVSYIVMLEYRNKV